MQKRRWVSRPRLPRTPASPLDPSYGLTNETIIGGGAPAAITYQHPMVLKNVLKAVSFTPEILAKAKDAMGR